MQSHLERGRVRSVGHRGRSERLQHWDIAIEFFPVRLSIRQLAASAYISLQGGAAGELPLRTPVNRGTDNTWYLQILYLLARSTGHENKVCIWI